MLVPKRADARVFSAEQGKNDTSFYPCGLDRSLASAHLKPFRGEKYELILFASGATRTERYFHFGAVG